jgi:hypothetical protein
MHEQRRTWRNQHEMAVHSYESTQRLLDKNSYGDVFLRTLDWEQRVVYIYVMQNNIIPFISTLFRCPYDLANQS